MLIVASAVLLLAMPVLLWPLVRPPREDVRAAAPDEREIFLHAAEEIELDLASGRLDQAEAERRIAELRRAPQ